MPDELNSQKEQLKSPTIPSSLKMSAHGFPDEEYAKDALQKFYSIISEISQRIDISNLDGVTVSFDYEKSLAELDHGYDTDYTLTPTKDVGFGVAMAPNVFRDGKLRTHLVFNAPGVLRLLENPGEDTELFSLSLYIIIHECAHVEVAAKLDQCFPGILLRKEHNNILDHMRWQAILPTWEEYAVCKIAGTSGHDQTEEYLETLCKVLEKTRSDCFERIRRYRIHCRLEQIVAEVYNKLGDLMKYASYFLGAALAHDHPETHPSKLIAEKEFAWFDPFYEKLIIALQTLWDQYGRWTNQNNFEVLGDILEAMAEDIGIKAERISKERTHFHMSFGFGEDSLGREKNLCSRISLHG